MHLLQKLDLRNSDVKLYMLRLDKIHPTISGNKYFKLKYNLEEARKSGLQTLLTFGGAFSNHIAATAAAGKEYGFNTIGVIRGEENSIVNPTLSEAVKNGMQLHFVSRGEYRKKESAFFIDELKKLFGDFYLIPEGGSNALAVKGCKEITGLIEIDFDYICCPVGTGGTIAGICCGLKEHQNAIGFSSLKGGEFLTGSISKLTDEAEPGKKVALNLSINTDFHFGGYAKVPEDLRDFKNKFQKDHGVELDLIYTAKMMYGVLELIHANYFRKGSTVVAVHTGGVQGNRGFE